MPLSEKFKPVRKDVMSYDPKHLSDKRECNKLYIDINLTKSVRNPPNRIEVFLKDFYIWIYPQSKTFEVLGYGE